jgi:sodium-dependent phosphate transporter
MIGMAWALGGYDCIIWYEPLDTFPYVGGVGGIALSWVVSPLFSALIAGTLYGTLRRWILRRNFEAAGLNIAYPTIIGLTITLNIFFVIYKGAKGLGLDKIPIGIALGAAFGGGTVVAIIVVPFVPRIKRYVVRRLEGHPPEVEMPSVEANIEAKRESLNIRDDRELNRIVRLHSEAEKFDPRTEEVFKYLQIFTAMCASFSHGANDVANAIGPFAAIYTIWQVGDVQKNSVMEENAYWILSIGGVGITVGLLTYGYRIMYAMGDKLCKISPARGVAIELTSALVVITGSRLKIPLSTTHCQIGATVGVGALEDCRRCGGINCKIFMRTVAGWILTLIFVGGTTGLLVAQGMYSPPLQKCVLTNVTG